MNGHWFCSACEDVAFLPAPVGRWDPKHGVQCAVCHMPTVDWIPDTPPKTKPAMVSPEVGKKLFEKMKEAVK